MSSQPLILLSQTPSDPMIPWPTVNTVFLDMDGTLLDLHFDNHFWREHVPARFAEKHGLDIDQARSELFPRFARAEGTLDWYCVDYWSRELELDIEELKREVDHLIAVHPHVIEFLDQLRQAKKRIVLVTNAHGKSVDIKFERTRISGHFDAVISSHELGLPKEHLDFWERLQSAEQFNRETTLLIDDSLPVLQSAKRYGIAHLLAVYHPDSKGPRRNVEPFSAIEHFTELMPITD
jgi:HAD superfamily hydrolase (TIGR01509 family)